MNDKMLDLIGQADEKYLREAQGTPQMRIKHKRRFSAGIAAVVAAAMCLTTVGAFAAYKAYHKDSVNDFYNSSTESHLESSGYKVGDVVENEHFRITRDIGIKDDIMLKSVFTVEALDEAAKEYLKQWDVPAYSLYYTDKNEKTSGFDMAYNSIKGKKNEDTNEDSSSRAFSLVVPCDSVDVNRPMSIRFGESDNKKTYNGKQQGSDELLKGLELKLDSKEAKSIELYSKDNAKMIVSELTLDIESNDDEDYNEKYNFNLSDCEIHFKDGITKVIGDSDSQNFTALKNGDNGNIEHYTCDLRDIIDVDNVDYVKMQDIEFRAK
ncbi:MAG: hypothetical protein IJ172_06210 [Ruminococcus sp.]|nr:hypothetical protein [Ruminococcus sp.]